MEVVLAALIDSPSAILAQSRTITAWLHCALALALAFLPFELSAGIGIAALTFTNVEILALGALALWIALLVYERRWPRTPRHLALLALVLLSILFASAALAPAWRGAALKFTARQAQGALLALCLADQLAAHGWPLARRLGLALIAGASASAALGLAELTESPAIVSPLAIFKEQPTMAGGLLRLSGTFAYANIAAMYYEAALPLALIAAGLVAGRRTRLLLGGAAVVLFCATLLTYSRAALLTGTAAVAIVVLAVLILERRGASWAADHSRVVRLGALLLAIAASLLVFNPAFRVRIAEPDVANWYRAAYAVAPLPRLAPNALIETPVSVHNRGLVTWRSTGLRPIALSYHWLDPRSGLVVRYNGRRTLLPQPVAPGDTLRLNAELQAPDKPGAYLLVWDMVVEHSGWFSERGNPVAEVAVTVAGAPASRAAPGAEPAGMPQRISEVPPPPARRELWRAALRLWQTQPLLGIGPDVFRHVYGPELGLRLWDDRVHTNSLYLELLVGAGIAGLLAFLTLIVSSLLRAARLLAREAALARSASAPASLRWAALACVVALTTFLIHGVFDMFLEYSATYLLLWGLIGALGGLAAIDDNHH